MRILSCFALMCVSAILFPARAQNVLDSIASLGIAYYRSTDTREITAVMDSAFKYKTGNLKEYNPERAFSLLMECAQIGSPRAMNMVGGMYMDGIGVSQSDVLAAEWFRKSAQSGYLSAWNNLGQAYHYARGVEQDFYKEYACYQKVNNYFSWFSLGYLHYKGLGCTQDYSMAVAYFLKSARANAGAQYLLGLCYRNGYGVERNMHMGDSLVALARDNGAYQARFEAETSAPENSMNQSILKSAVEVSGPKLSSYRRVKHNLGNRSLEGEYAGYLIRYDWSGQVAIDQSAIRLSLTQKGNRIQGEWYDGDLKVASVSGTLTDTALIFDQGEYRRTGHYQPVLGVVHQLKQALLEAVYLDSVVYLAGNVKMYLPEAMEPAKPMYLTLKRLPRTVGSASNKIPAVPASASADNGGPPLDNLQAVLQELRAYPNPFENRITIAFTLRSGGDVTIQVFNALGQPVFSTVRAGLAQGQHTENISVSGAAGAYIIRLNHKGKTATTMVIKQ